MIKTLIIDDERRSREVLRELIAQIEGLVVVGEAENADAGLEAILSLEPDLIFLDIEMPVKSGFELMRELAVMPARPEVIFVTAYDKYAIEAFKYAAFDYLLKPVAPQDLKDSYLRFLKKRKAENQQKKIEKLVDFLDQKERIKFDLRTGMLIIDPEELIYCEADGNYTHLILADGKKEVVSYNLGYVAEQIENHGFYRLSRSVLVNIAHIIKLDQKNRLCEVRFDHSYVKFKIPASKVRELQNLV